MAPVQFRLVAELPGVRARAGILETPHGRVETPVFVPVGTQATVKSLTPDEVRGLGGQIILANTYHLYLRPGSDLIARFGGLHGFMAWDGPIITDSGGYQAFSLGFALEHGVGKIVKMFPGERVVARTPQRPKLAKIDEEGVVFTSHIDGSHHRLTPERSIGIQQELGSDIILAFDECTSPLATYEYTREALGRTHRWAIRCLEAKTSPDQALFGIVQGGEWQDLREESARFIGALPFDGFAIGGSLGKSKEDMYQILDWTTPLLPVGKARHLLGIGEPVDLFEGIQRGIDSFDCVAPTRLARHGVLETHTGRLHIRNARYREDPLPIEVGCGCYTCRTFTRAYLRHLFVTQELLGYRLATIHNLWFTLQLVRQIRVSIIDGSFFELKRSFRASYQAEEEEPGEAAAGE